MLELFGRGMGNVMRYARLNVTLQSPAGPTPHVGHKFPVPRPPQTTSVNVACRAIDGQTNEQRLASFITTLKIN